jgi:ferredoxin
MIVGDRKPLEEILESIKDYNKILLLGCGGCVTICFSGGEKAAGLLASQITIARKSANNPIEIEEWTPTRVCEHEFIDELKEKIDSVDAVLSLSCGVGVQTLAEQYEDRIIVPALNTTFMGYPVEHGVWEERCAGCGNCVLEWTGGLCPISRCAKKLLNGPCGGSADGVCEVDSEKECIWHLIYDRLKRLGKLENLEKVRDPKDWRTSTNAGQRKSVFEEAQL